MKNCEISTTYEELLPTLPLGLQKKLTYSVNFLRKAEKLANVEWWISGKSYDEWIAVAAQGSLFDDSQIKLQ